MLHRERIIEMAGSKKFIETPEKLWSLFKEYEADCKGNPILMEDYVGGKGERVQREKQRCLTLEGFEDYLFEGKIISDLGDYFANTDLSYTDYQPTCRAIKRKIRRDQIEGGMAGIYNPNITQRLNGLVDKIQEDGSKEVTIKVKYERKDSNT